MLPLFLTWPDFNRLLDGWASKGPVYVPLKKAGYRHWRRYDPVAPALPELDGIRAVEPMKAFYFHVKEPVATYPVETDFLAGEAPFYVVGAKNCDLRSAECLDHTFARGETKDPFWVTRRDKAVVVGADCSNPPSTCFCTLLGMKPYPDSTCDLSVAVVNDGLVVDVWTEKGKTALDIEGVSPLEASAEQIAERDANRERTRNEVVEQNRQFETRTPFNDLVAGNFESPAWIKYVGRCREDAACLSVCPTCHCFVLYDEKKQEGGQRVRVWDFCYLRGYTRCGGGHSARATGNDRFKNKYVKKFQFYPTQFGMPACTGCGRCIEACLAKIDMRQVMKDLEAGE